MIPKIIIGCGYGDEGKGATTNYLSSPNSTVVRFNGGSQAGHTVVHNGFRHIFSSIGSGTLKGASTHLSKYFVLEPGGFNKEYEHLCKNGFTPKVSIDPNSYITTPYDIYINRQIENKRGNNRHGSVGVGFGETIERSEMGFPIFVKDLFDEQLLWQKLDKIQDYVWHRHFFLGLGLHLFDIEFDITSFIKTCQLFLQRTSIIEDETIINERDELIFEGAQGLLLDPEYGTMPYCTRSSCGLKNPSLLLGNRPYEVYYVTRPYTTRHGAGPLPFECKIPDFVVDKTNKGNEFQGSLRYAPLNLRMITKTMNIDNIKYGKNKQSVTCVITCFDQIENEENIQLVIEDKICTLKVSDFIEDCKNTPNLITLSNQHV